MAEPNSPELMGVNRSAVIERRKIAVARVSAMDVRVSAVTPTPIGQLDLGEQLARLLAATPVGSLLGPLVGRVFDSATTGATNRIGKLINVTVIVIKENPIEITVVPREDEPPPRSRKPTATSGNSNAKKPPAKKQPSEQAVASP
jgi:hypothetical protein